MIIAAMISGAYSVYPRLLMASWSGSGFAAMYPRMGVVMVIRIVLRRPLSIFSIPSLCLVISYNLVVDFRLNRLSRQPSFLVSSLYLVLASFPPTFSHSAHPFLID